LGKCYEYKFQNYKIMKYKKRVLDKSTLLNYL
jgi:hypothetical protein